MKKTFKELSPGDIYSTVQVNLNGGMIRGQLTDFYTSVHTSSRSGYTKDAVNSTTCSLTVEVNSSPGVRLYVNPETEIEIIEPKESK